MSAPSASGGPSIRIGKAGAGVIRKPSARNRPMSEFRTTFYQRLLALSEWSERLLLDWLRQPDGFGLEWCGLARQVARHGKTEALSLLDELRGMIMSKEGAQFLPKGLYRTLLDRLDECDEFVRWARGAGFEEALDEWMGMGASAEPAGQRYRQQVEKLKKTGLDLQQQICIFENEREPSEESFFG